MFDLCFYFLCVISYIFFFFFFFFNDTATTEIYTLSLHDALPISGSRNGFRSQQPWLRLMFGRTGRSSKGFVRSEEHTSELQSQSNLVCRLLLEKKKKINKTTQNTNEKNSNTNYTTNYS